MNLAKKLLIRKRPNTHVLLCQRPKAKQKVGQKVGQRSVKGRSRSIKGRSKVGQGHAITDGQPQRSNRSKVDQELTKVESSYLETIYRECVQYKLQRYSLVSGLPNFFNRRRNLHIAKRLKPLVKPCIVSRTCLNLATPQDPPSTCWHSPLSVENSTLQSNFGHLYMFCRWNGLCKC